MILKELTSNLAILITCLFIYSQFTNESSLRTSSSLRKKVVAGALAGVLSNILMQYSMHFDQTIVDLRHIPLLIVTYYGGFVPSLVAVLFIIVGRFFISFDESSLLAIAFIALIALAALGARKLKRGKRTKIFLSLTASHILFTILILYLIRDSDILLIMVPSYWIISYVAGFSSFYVIEYVRRNQRMMLQFKAQSTTDPLTGLNNVRKFDQVFNSVSEEARKRDERLSFLFIDIDHFKRINDTYGHKEGDEVLIGIGDLLTQAVRSFDIVSRNGGEEFTVILLDCSTDRAMQIGERIRGSVEDHSFLLTTGETIGVTVSIGVACYQETTDSPEALLNDADQALYEAKRTGRNKVCIA